MTAPQWTSGRRWPRGLPAALGSRVAPGLSPVALGYAVPSLVAAIAVQTWFRSDAALASGDLVPPVAPGTEYRAHWNGFDTGAGAPSFQVVSLPYFEGLRLFSWLGLGEVAFQRVWLTVLLAGTAAAVVFLARGLVRSPLAAAVAGFIPLFSAYRLTLAFDPVPLVAMIAAAVLGGLVIRAGGEHGPRPLVFGLASLPCGFVLLNPPHLALVLAWVAVCVLLAWAAHGPQTGRRLGPFLLKAGALAVLFNLWWIVPAALTLTSPVFSDRFAAAGVDEWAWTHVRSGVLEVVAFTSSWAWPHPEYFPFSARLERVPFAALQYVPAVAAALGLVLASGRRRDAALVLAAVAVVAIWVMKGLHPPLGGTNRWLYDNLPGFWLLRDPAKAGLVLVLAFALLAALGVACLAERSRRVAAAAALLVVGGGAAYAHPLLTGAVAPTERPLLPSAHVRVPSGWRAAATYLERRPEGGKVVVLPRLDYYQAPTTWGYYGGSFLHHLIDRPVIEPLPEGYYRDPEVDSLVAQLQAEILGGGREVTDLLQALGARYVVLRRDLDAGFPGRSFASPERLAARLAGIAELRHLRGFGQADVYEAPGVRTPEVYPARPLSLGSEPIELRRSLAERVGDCHKYDDRSLAEVGIAARVTDSATLRLAARDHSACVAIPVAAARAGRPLRIRLAYRRLAGNPARLCVWQDGPDRCATLPPLDASRGWHVFAATVTPAAGTESVRLFLYADGDRGGRRVTRTEYRRLTVTPQAPELGVTVEPGVRLPEVSYRRSAPGEFRVRVEGANRPFVLVAAETFAPGWRIEAAGRDGEDIAHFRVNGYANGWRIPWTGSYELTLSYGPERLAQVARRLDLVAVPLGVLALVLGPLRTRWARLRARRREG